MSSTVRGITVFTPTYNRAHLLPFLYNSLCEQTNKDFEWLIVDDGSSDNTRDLITTWISAGLVSIRYIYQCNGGKMRAHNTGVNNTLTELFVCVDSDDYLVDDAIDRILSVWRQIPPEHRHELAGIVGYKGKSREETMYGEKFPDIEYSPLYRLYDEGFRGETTLVYRTQILKAHLFPEFEGEKFIPEKYVYRQIDKSYLLKVLPQVLTICEYHPDGYTMGGVSTSPRMNPKGYRLFFLQESLLAGDWIRRLKFMGGCVACSFMCKDFSVFAEPRHVFWSILSLPIALLYMLKYRQ